MSTEPYDIYKSNVISGCCSAQVYEDGRCADCKDFGGEVKVTGLLDSE